MKKFLDLSSWSLSFWSAAIETAIGSIRHTAAAKLQVYLLTVLALTFSLAACGDDDSSFAPRDNTESDSDIVAESTQSSSSITTATPCNVDGVNNCVTDSRDGKTYRTVKIGDQVWMAENLNYAYTGVPYNFDVYTSDSTSWCYDNVPANCTKYGRLYTWAAAMDSVGEWSTNGKGCGYDQTCSPTYPVRGVCPEGWHLPSNDEWEALIVAVDGSITEYTNSNTAGSGSKLKSLTGWKTYIGITNEDAFGFSAFPAGYRINFGDFSLEGFSAYFWSSTEDVSNLAYLMYLDYGYGGADLGSYSKYYGFSVRCLKDLQ